MRAGQWHDLGNDNFFMQDFAECGEELPDGWSAGQITWRIPTAWGYRDDDDAPYCPKEFGEPYYQIFTMNENGVLRVSKLGFWVERSPNGMRNRSDNVEERIQ